MKNPTKEKDPTIEERFVKTNDRITGFYRYFGDKFDDKFDEQLLEDDSMRESIFWQSVSVIILSIVVTIHFVAPMAMAFIHTYL